MSRQLQIRLVNVANAGGRAMRDEWPDPVCIPVAQSVRTKRMDMHRDRPRYKVEVGIGERPGDIRIVPAVIQRAVRHWITLRKDSGDWAMIYNWDSNFVELLRNFRQPLVAYFVTGRGTVRAIDIGPPPKPSSLGRDRIDDHLSHSCCAGGIQPANEKERDVLPL